MSPYLAPLTEMRFVMNELARPRRGRGIARLRGRDARYGRRDPRGGRQVRLGRARSAQSRRRSRGSEAGPRRQGHHAARIPRSLRAVLRARLERAREEPGLRRPGHAAARGCGGRRDVQRGQHGVRALPDAHRRRDRSDRAQRLGGAEAHLPAEDGLRRVDRHDEPDRAAGRFGSRRRAHEGRAAGRRQLQALRQQDLHHLRRARLHREHRPPGARADAGRALPAFAASLCSSCRSFW